MTPTICFPFCPLSYYRKVLPITIILNGTSFLRPLLITPSPLITMIISAPTSYVHSPIISVRWRAAAMCGWVWYRPWSEWRVGSSTTALARIRRTSYIAMWSTAASWSGEWLNDSLVHNSDAKLAASFSSRNPARSNCVKRTCWTNSKICQCPKGISLTCITSLFYLYPPKLNMNMCCIDQDGWT